MNETSAPEQNAAGAALIRLPARRPPDIAQTFNRKELIEILNLYGLMVSRAEWRDYALDFTPSRAVFSVFRRTSERPLFQIVKDARILRKHGAYSVVSGTGAVLKRSHDLARALDILRPRPRLMLV